MRKDFDERRGRVDEPTGSFVSGKVDLEEMHIERVIVQKGLNNTGNTFLHWEVRYMSSAFNYLSMEP